MRKRIFALPEFIATRLMGLWVRPDVLPESPATLLDTRKPVVYVLEFGGLADRVALNIVCTQLGLPNPMSGFSLSNQRDFGAVVVLRQHRGGLFRLSSTKVSRRLERIISRALPDQSDHVETCTDPGPDPGPAPGDSPVQLVPVAIYWGRSPDREASVFKQLFSENWKVGGRTAKFFKSFIHARYTLVQFSEPLSLAPIIQDNLPAPQAARKVSRILRVHFRHRRISTLGPDLSHRRTLINRVLQNSSVVTEIEKNSAGDPALAQKMRAEATGYAYEIAADISYPAIRVMRKVLTRLWNRLYDGVVLDGVERLTSVAEGKELIYVPCHRSHIDYLLLSYSLYMQGMSLPHIAAGVNLNLPLVGQVLRRGGGFFLRRSFRGNRLYAMVFNAYLQEILQRGHALEYFIEGGRSRTGRLLKPKGGMLAMTVQGFLNEPRRPLLFVPVNFGYERLVEGGAFASELSGKKKQKETLGGLLRSLKLLRQEFGSVYVNFGTPIEFNDRLDAARPGWRNEGQTEGRTEGQNEALSEERREWLKPVIEELGDEIMTRINSATSVTPISLLSLAMLTTSHGRMAFTELDALLALYQTLHRALPYSEEVAMTPLAPAEIIQHGVDLAYISRDTYELGDIACMPAKQTIPLSFFRNNVLHLFMLPASIACCFIHRESMEVNQVSRLVYLSYPFLRSELFLRWSTNEIREQIKIAIDTLVDLELLHWNEGRTRLCRSASGSPETFLLRALGLSAMPSLQRYYLTLSVLSRVGSGRINVERLGEVCRQCAERLQLMHGLQSPDFYDKEIFSGIVKVMTELGAIQIDDSGNLRFDKLATGLEADTQDILGEQVCHSILSMTNRFHA